jgi:DNA-binding Lrp family transcriptional regulator
MPGIDYEFHSAFNDNYTIPTRRIVRMLSENSRTSLTQISSALELSRRNVKERIDKIETALGIHYTLELNEELLGASVPHIAVLEFEKKPDYDYLAKLLKKSYIPQLAFSVKGKNLVYIYAVSASRKDYVYWDNTMSVLLSDYGVDWYSSEIIHKQMGFVPLRTELIEKLNIDIRIKELLKLLNENSRASIQELSRSIGKHFNTVTYTFHQLQQSGYIKRFTLTMDRQEKTSPVAFLLKYVPKKDFEKDAAKTRLALKSDDKYSLISRYIFTAPLIGSWDYFGMGVFDNYKLGHEHCLSYIKQVAGRHISNDIFNEIDKVLVGRLPFRSIETKTDYSLIDWTADTERL